MYEARTDLALESGERFRQNHVEIHGVAIKETMRRDCEIKTTIVTIETENGAAAMGKPQGTYITIEAPDLSAPSGSYQKEAAEEVSQRLQSLFPFQENQTILIVGLGNPQVTPDALGPWTAEKIRITRHLIKNYGNNLPEDTYLFQVSALTPGVMALTGMETYEIVKGVVDHIQPDVVIAIDALAARGIKRLGRTIQMTDAGVHPGSGVGNHRKGLTRKTLGVPVIGIGVPTVVDAATIVHDASRHMLDALDEYEQQEFLEELLTPNLRSMFVTPKDVDEIVLLVSETIANGINQTFSQRFPKKSPNSY